MLDNVQPKNSRQTKTIHTITMSSEEFESCTYPQLSAPVDLPPASAPEDPAVNAMHKRHDVYCGVCNVIMKPPQGAAYGVLSCGHRTHLACLLRFAVNSSRRLALPEESIGGSAHCGHCREQVSMFGGCSENTNPETRAEVCMRKLREKHASSYAMNADKIAEAQPTPEMINEMLGIKKSNSVISSLLSVAKNVKSAAAERGWAANVDAEETDEQIETKKWREMPTGREFVDEMLARKRTIDDIFATFKYALPHLYSAGVQTLDELKQLGFNAAIHLDKKAYGAVAPVFFLVSRYGLSYANSVADLCVDQIAQLGLSARELLVLGIDAPLLMQTGITKRELISFDIAPSNWVKFLSLQPSHLVVMGFKRARDFAADEKWRNNIAKNSKAKQLMDDTLVLQSGTQ